MFVDQREVNQTGNYGINNQSARPEVGWRTQEVDGSDATWILTSAFIIFTMQSGFGLLESGSVSVKNELNIMVKNAVDVVFGGLAYWTFGYGLSFGEDGFSNAVFGWGNFCVNSNDDKLGWIYSKFFFQASFATTATTIVSGAMAERTKLTSYMVFSIVNTILFSLPAHWVWATNGWLYKFGIVDIAGAGPVHLIGALSAMAERTKLTSYMVFSIVNTILFSLPAHWVWATNGWLYKFGIVDIAGAGPVHLVGGLSAMDERTKLTSYMVFSIVNTILFSLPAHWLWATNGWLYKFGIVDIAGAGPVPLVGAMAERTKLTSYMVFSIVNTILFSLPAHWVWATNGAMAERTKLTSYMVFSIVNTILFSLPAHWVWATNGWLYKFGIVDIAGAGPVHLVGGLTGLVATMILKPRYRRYKDKKAPQMSSPTNAVLGMFMLWWGWLGFNCGSTFGISGSKWKLAARSAASTLSSSVSGGVAGFLLSYIVRDRKFDVTYLINGLLGSLVSITAICALVQPWEGIVIGFIGSIIANGSVALLDKLKIDDPVGCVGTHAMSGAWGLLAAGLFTRDDSLLDALYLNHVKPGLFYGGGFRQLGVQALGVAAISGWSVVVSFLFLKTIDLVFGLRVSLIEEIIGADIVEHGMGNVVYDRKTKKIIHQDGDNEREIQTSDDLSTLHERELRSMRDRSLANFSHLLGHSVRRKSVQEINDEIDHERLRSLRARANGHTNNGFSESIEGVDTIVKQSKFRMIWNRLKGERTQEVDSIRHVSRSRSSSMNGVCLQNGTAVTKNRSTSNGHIISNGVIHTRDLSDISEGVGSEDDIVIQLSDGLQTVSRTNSGLVNRLQTSEMTHI